MGINQSVYTGSGSLIAPPTLIADLAKPAFRLLLCAGTNPIRKPVISPEPCQSDSLGEGSEEHAGSHRANDDQQSHSKCLSNQGGRIGHRGLTSLCKRWHHSTCRHQACCQSISDNQHCLCMHSVPLTMLAVN